MGSTHSLAVAAKKENVLEMKRLSRRVGPIPSGSVSPRMVLRRMCPARRFFLLALSFPEFSASCSGRISQWFWDHENS